MPERLNPSIERPYLGLARARRKYGHNMGLSRALLVLVQYDICAILSMVLSGTSNYASDSFCRAGTQQGESERDEGDIYWVWQREAREKTRASTACLHGR